VGELVKSIENMGKQSKGGETCKGEKFEGKESTTFLTRMGCWGGRCSEEGAGKKGGDQTVMGKVREPRGYRVWKEWRQSRCFPFCFREGSNQYWLITAGEVTRSGLRDENLRINSKKQHKKRRRGKEREQEIYQSIVMELEKQTA